MLLELSRYDDVDALLEEYEDDWISEWLYTRALRAFSKGGTSESARESLEDALEQNPYVPDYLTGRKRIPNRLPELVSLGRESEVASYAASHLNDWRRTHGAVEWLKEQTQSPEQKSAKKIKPDKKTKRGRRSKKK